MSTLPTTQFLSVDFPKNGPIDPRVVMYFCAQSQSEMHDIAVGVFLRESSENGLTKGVLAKRIDKAPEQITRLLGSPGNWGSDTFTSLLLGMGYVPTFGVKRIADYFHPAPGVYVTTTVSGSAQSQYFSFNQVNPAHTVAYAQVSSQTNTSKQHAISIRTE